MNTDNINIITIAVESDLTDISEGIIYNRITEEIKAQEDIDGKYYIDINLITFIEAVSSDEDPYLDESFNIMITMGYIDENKFKNSSLGRAKSNLSKNMIHNQLISVKAFSSQRIRLNLSNYAVDRLGTYYIKTYIKDSKLNHEDAWQLQCVNTIKIIN